MRGDFARFVIVFAAVAGVGLAQHHKRLAAQDGMGRMGIPMQCDRCGELLERLKRLEERVEELEATHRSPVKHGGSLATGGMKLIEVVMVGPDEGCKWCERLAGELDLPWEDLVAGERIVRDGVSYRKEMPAGDRGPWPRLRTEGKPELNGFQTAREVRRWLGK